MITEHEKTIEILRQDYIDQLGNIGYERYTKNPALLNSLNELRVFDTATLLQLRALVRLVTRADDTCDFKIVRTPTGSDPYLGVTFRGMFVGIEPDGYTHS